MTHANKTKKSNGLLYFVIRACKLYKLFLEDYDNASEERERASGIASELEEKARETDPVWLGEMDVRMGLVHPEEEEEEGPKEGSDGNANDTAETTENEHLSSASKRVRISLDESLPFEPEIIKDTDASSFLVDLLCEKVNTDEQPQCTVQDVQAAVFKAVFSSARSHFESLCKLDTPNSNSLLQVTKELCEHFYPSTCPDIPREKNKQLKLITEALIGTQVVITPVKPYVVAPPPREKTDDVSSTASVLPLSNSIEDNEKNQSEEGGNVENEIAESILKQQQTTSPDDSKVSLLPRQADETPAVVEATTSTSRQRLAPRKGQVFQTTKRKRAVATPSPSPAIATAVTNTATT